MADFRKPVLGVLKAIQTASKAADEQLAVEKAVKAADRANAGRMAADVTKATAPMKMSEALGNMNLEGKGKLKITQADRTRVGGGNIGGPMFSGLQQIDPFYKDAAWGVGEKSTASKMINQSDDNTLWSTVLGSADQLKTNPIVFNKLRKGFTDSMKQGNLSPELEAKINHNLALTFGEGAEIRDPKIWQKADTFEKRGALADAMLGQGIPPSKGGVALGGEKSGKGVIFRPTDILKRETEPNLLHTEHGGDVPTFAVGPRLFSLSGETMVRPDLHPGFPVILKGEDKGVVFNPVAGLEAMPEFVKRHKEVKGREPSGYFDWTMGLKGEGLPTQPISEEYLTYLQKLGKKKGGTVTREESKEDMARFQKRFAMHKAIGGKVQSKPVRMASGGKASIFDKPVHMVDGGKIAKGLMGAINKAEKAADAAMAARKVEAPSVIIPSKISNVKEAVRQSKGDYGARRVERAADEIPSLERLYQEDALKEAFIGDNARALMTMNPKDFEKYASPIPPSMSKPQQYRGYGSQFLDDSMKNMTLSEYIDNLSGVKGGFADVPYLLINKQEQGLPLTPFISGHEGRHRSRALANKGEEGSLVQLLPRAELREPLPRRTQEEYIEALKKELEMTGNKVVPQRYQDSDAKSSSNIFSTNKDIIRPAVDLPDIYAKGGRVQESPEDMARFNKRFAMHKAIGGHVKKMASGGRASIFDAPAKRMSKGGSSDEPTAKEIAEALGELTVNQAKEEYESYKKPRAATDIANRGILAPAVGAPVDLINMGLAGIDFIGSKATGKPIRLSSEKPFGGSEHLKDLMDKYGVTSGEDRPMTETALSLFSPTGMIKGAMGMTKGALKAADAMRKPMSGAMRAKAN